MVPIRKTRAKASEDYGPDPALDLPGGAHLGIKSVKVFPPKFNEDTGDLWGSIVSMRLTVIDDRTEDGDADGLEFDDRFELKIDEDLGFDDDKLKNANVRDFTKEVQETLLDQRNWTIRENTKLDKLLSALYGVAWTRFNKDDLVGKEFIAKLHPRTGKLTSAPPYTHPRSCAALHRGVCERSPLTELLGCSPGRRCLVGKWLTDVVALGQFAIQRL
jgi:hypothetical protein